MDTMWKKRKKITAFLLAGILILSQWIPALEKGGQDAGFGTVLEVQADSVAETLNPTVDTVLSTVRQYILSRDTSPDYISSTWNVIGLSRSGLDVPQEYFDSYYRNTIAYLKENNWILSKSKYSDYSKLIIAMTAIGKDARNVEGHNLLAYLSDFKNVTKQGFNGPIWALMALKSHPDYIIPLDASASEQTTEEVLVQYLLDKEVWSGGWTLTGNIADADITGMAIQALSTYYGKRKDVTEAIDRALEWLSKTQLASGGYATLGTETSESVSQIIVALSSVGVDGAKDQRFIKNGKWPMTGLFQYYLPEGGFMHVAAGAGNNGGAEAGILDGMATEQGLYATVAYKRMLDGKTALYDMSDVTLDTKEDQNGGGTPVITPDTSPTTSTETTTTETESKPNTVKVIRLTLDYSEISLKKGKTKTLKASVTPSNATNKKLKWSTSNKKVATVTQKGKVKGKKAGTATITATTKDGSKLKAVCKVTVTAKAKTTTTQSTSNRSETKKVNLTSTSASATTAAASTTTTAAQETNTTAEGAESTEALTDTESMGWSFEGEDYIPESETEEMTEEEAGFQEGWLPGATPEDYILVGAGSTLLLEFIIWACWSGWKKRKIRMAAKAEEPSEQEVG